MLTESIFCLFDLTLLITKLQVHSLKWAAQSWLLLVGWVPMMVLLAALPALHLQVQLEAPQPVLMLALLPQLMLGLMQELQLGPLSEFLPSSLPEILQLTSLRLLP